MRTETVGPGTSRVGQPTVVPLGVRIPGVESEILLGGDRWRCRMVRRDPPLFVLTKLSEDPTFHPSGTGRHAGQAPAGRQAHVAPDPLITGPVSTAPAYRGAVQFEGWEDGSVLEAASWRLASELCRRHPLTTRLIRAHPGGGASDCLWLLPTDGDDGDVRLNRNGRIHVLARFDGREPDWEPVEWEEYFRADPKAFLRSLEAAAGLPAPPTVPASTPRTLTLRVLAAITATAVKSTRPIEVRSGMLDTSGGEGGPETEAFAAFPSIPAELLVRRPDDLLGHPEYRFWFVYRDDDPILAFEQSAALAWTRHHSNIWPLMDLYKESRRDVLVTALTLLRRVDHI